MEYFWKFGNELMATYAKLDETNIVLNIVVADSDWLGLSDGIWVSYSNKINPALIGSTYKPETNMFELFDENTQNWIVIYPQTTTTQ